MKKDGYVSLRIRTTVVGVTTEICIRYDLELFVFLSFLAEVDGDSLDVKPLFFCFTISRFTWLESPEDLSERGPSKDQCRQYFE